MYIRAYLCQGRFRATGHAANEGDDCWNKSPTPFAWTKPADAIIESHRRMLKRISTAVHQRHFAIMTSVDFTIATTESPA